MKLIETNLSNWTERWEPIVKKFHEITLKKMPVEKMEFKLLKDKLDTIERRNSV